MNGEKLAAIALKLVRAAHSLQSIIVLGFIVLARAVRAKLDQGDTNWEGRIQSIAIHRWIL